ncbi:hypothetical protein [uncultured Cytophaga sp.]|uniref:hypothetical protein n=1 Tax=uncultured Cytophaga sp. TaxID=160238 RepID=UPI002615F4B8|nr:hypothetical protein [uncultured Cytophaga sp.]
MIQDFVYILLGINLVVSVIFYLKKGCEIPIFIALFNALVQYRIISLELGYSQFIHFNYQIDFEFTMEMAYEISHLILLGSTVMMYTFMLLYKPIKVRLNDTNDYLKDFILSKKTIILIGLSFFSVFQLVFSSSISDSYGLLSKLANSSFILLMFLIFLNTNKTRFLDKVLYLIGFLAIGYITYSSELRFQFLGWMIPVGYFLVRNVKPVYKLYLMVVGMFCILVIFSAARVMRYQEAAELSSEELYGESYERLQESDDVNFIDGFMMMYQVYPKYLDHTYGIEHLNIIFRPIPRSIWSSKPLAGWFQNYQEKYGLEIITIGFSPTIYGVFYAEGGVLAIPIFAVLWAYFLSWLYRKLSAYESDLSYLLIGILLTALIPIFRSGDLAGDVAIVLMSYWPIIVFVYQYKKYVRKRLRDEQEA